MGGGEGVRHDFGSSDKGIKSVKSALMVGWDVNLEVTILCKVFNEYHDLFIMCM